MDLQARQATADEHHAEDLENGRAMLQAAQQNVSSLAEQLNSSVENSRTEAAGLRASLTTAQVHLPKHLPLLLVAEVAFVGKAKVEH